MIDIIDLSQEIYEGMPVFKDLPQVKMTIHNSHEEWSGIKNPEKKTPAVHKLELGEHTGTHVDAINHMAKQYEGQSIDTMPLSMFYTEGICLDFSHKNLKELIEPEEIESACLKSKIEIKKGDTVLLYTDHYRKYFNTENWGSGPGISASCAKWLGEKRIFAFGVETMSPGVSGISNREVHHICGEMKFTHYENMVNLYKLIGRGRFRFIGLPLKIRGGTGSPVRAVAVFEN
ncbi:cyclase family protein [Salegentibacter mishustinae]|uniref:Cyclase n=1 Tax=Salegentibacter mishustinae TaxID=270918 RepID=A0A0Q9ZJV1_9FLAO|nr:cyclase family protein [Salegentibacter mishustinae]KRG29566.1 cyclase [Salegentibacter mishustinae]PNW21337.1 cyclase [Salegentibacter mishustinae]PZX60628.1 kynurenine formamidase [Salegentibacter mishustinae]GGX00793.1 cyclase [Salegentibacter mishustinae]